LGAYDLPALDDEYDPPVFDQDRQALLAAIAERVAGRPDLYERLPQSVRWELLRWERLRPMLERRPGSIGC
jgi:hypothetical protein